MKAVIVEIRGETAAALGRDGSVFKVKNRSYAVGQTIDVRRGGLSRQLAVLAAAAAAVFLIVGAGIHTYLSPYSLVSLDVNPSLQYTLNRLGLVLSVEASFTLNLKQDRAKSSCLATKAVPSWARSWNFTTR